MANGSILMLRPGLVKEFAKGMGKLVGALLVNKPIVITSMTEIKYKMLLMLFILRLTSQFWGR